MGKKTNFFTQKYRLSSLCVLSTFCLAMGNAASFGALSFLGVAAGDATDTEVVLWTRGVDGAAPAAASLTLQISTSPTLAAGVTSLATATDAAHDYIAKVNVTSLLPGTTYYYRFMGPNGELSIIGRFKTAPSPTASVPVRMAFSGDLDGLMRPYAAAKDFQSQNLDFFVFLGDTIYETASTGSAATTSTASATQAQLFTDYYRKYREQFLPVNSGGQPGLQNLFSAQGNYTVMDNHELGNKVYINGGAAPGGPVGGMPTGAGVDPAVTGNDVNSSGLFLNKAVGFQTLQQVYMDYQPVKERGLQIVPSDPRTDGTRQLYFAQRWGKNAIFVNVDDRSYRDIRMKTAGGADDAGVRAANPNRTMLGATHLAWLKQTLLDAQTAGVTYKIVAVSSPIDQLGPISGALTGVSNGGNTGYTPVASDGGKSWIGQYRAERNNLLKFIADHQIKNVIFLSTDDHQNRVNEVLYSPSGQTEVQSSYVRVPYCFIVVDGPLAATGPDLITNHTFANNKTIADSLATAQQNAGLDPIGLDPNYPGLRNLVREGDPQADTLRQPVDFYSPDTYNFATLDISADGKTLTVKTLGLNSYAGNTFPEYDANTNPLREIVSFQVDAPAALSSSLQVTRGGYVLNRKINKVTQLITLKNTTAITIIGPINLALDSVSANTGVANGNGVTANNAPLGSPYVTVSSGNLAPGASASVVVNFNVPSTGGITYTPRPISGAVNP